METVKRCGAKRVMVVLAAAGSVFKVRANTKRGKRRPGARR